jgi:hypothetical protein
VLAGVGKEVMAVGWLNRLCWGIPVKLTRSRMYGAPHTTHTRRRVLWRGNHHRRLRANGLGGRRRGGGTCTGQWTAGGE